MNMLLLPLLLLLLRPHPVSTTTPTISLLMLCTRQTPIVSITCRMYNWHPTSSLCVALFKKADQECSRRKPSTTTTTTTTNDVQYHHEFELTLDMSHDVPIVVGAQQRGTYVLNLLTPPSVAALDFCHQASTVLGYQKPSCVQTTTKQFHDVRRGLSLQQPDRSSPTLPPTIVLNTQTTSDPIQTTIPLLLHQTWKTRDVPLKFQQWRQSWLRNHPHWVKQRVWSDRDNLLLVQNHFPELLTMYKGFRHTILRVDFARYLIMYVYGGVYADLDLESLQPIDALLFNTPGTQIVLGIENQHTKTVDISFMASVPHHPFWLQVIRTVVVSDGLQRIRDVLQITGNRMFTRVLNQALSTGALLNAVVYDVPTMYAPCYSVHPNNGTMRVTVKKGYVAYKDNPTACRCGVSRGGGGGVGGGGDGRGCKSCGALFPTSHVLHHETGSWVDSFWKLNK